MFFIDANIFLELELEDKKWKESDAFLRKLAKNEFSAIISDFHVYSIILVMEAKTKSARELARFISAIQGFDSLYVYYPTNDDLMSATKIMERYRLTFDDALIVACMAANNIKRLVSFDADFDKVKEIERLEPDAVIGK